MGFCNFITDHMNHLVAIYNYYHYYCHSLVLNHEFMELLFSWYSLEASVWHYCLFRLLNGQTIPNAIFLVFDVEDLEGMGHCSKT